MMMMTPLYIKKPVFFFRFLLDPTPVLCQLSNFVLMSMPTVAISIVALILKASASQSDRFQAQIEKRKEKKQD